MVPIWSVLLLALFWGLCAALVGWGRKLTRRQALHDWMFASYPVAFATAAALFFFLMAARPEASVAWQNLAVACLLSAPPDTRNRKYSFPLILIEGFQCTSRENRHPTEFLLYLEFSAEVCLQTGRELLL